ncbi:MAG: DUF3107 domain-containing protein [Actinomycetaceae bacterium]|nr:DUF3107 domain-containing protein [Actinomycetaceae bacterium]
MLVTVGVIGCNRELRLQLDMSADALHKEIENCLTYKVPLKLTETNGNVVLIPITAIGYVQVTDEKPRPVGFTVS